MWESHKDNDGKPFQQIEIVAPVLDSIQPYFGNMLLEKPFEELWPDWYRGQGELFYYQKAFEKIIIPDGLHKLHFKTDRETTTLDELEQAIEQAGPYSVEDRKLAKEHENKAWDYYNNNDRVNALAMFEKSIGAFPFSEIANKMAGSLHYNNKDLQPALKYYLQANRIRERKKYVTMIRYLYDALKEHQKALEQYLLAYNSPHAEHIDTYHVMNAYVKLKDYDSAEKFAEEYIEQYADKDLFESALKTLADILGNYRVDHKKLVQTIPEYYGSLTTEEYKARIAYYLGVAYGEIGEKQTEKKWLLTARENDYAHDKNIELYLNKYR